MIGDINPISAAELQHMQLRRDPYRERLAIAIAKKAVLDIIASEPEPICPMDILATVNVRVSNIQYLLRRLLDDGAIRKVGRGRYTHARSPR
jgi:hypothetical protein